MSVQLHWVDYLVFLATLTVSCVIGVYFGCQNRSRTDTTDYLIAGRQMRLVPVILSLSASYISAAHFLGTPAETFAYGGQYMLASVGVMLGVLIGMVLFVPIIYPLKLTSVNEYLHLRFESRLVEVLGSLCALLGMMIFTSVTFYAPALAIEAVSPVPAWLAVVVAVIITIFYTTLGGIRAVMYADAFQTVIMLAGMLAVIGRAVYLVGDFATVWDLNKEYSRLNVFVFDFNPFIRMNFWGLTVGNAITLSSVFTVNQVAMQRYCSLPSLTQANVSLILMAPCFAMMSLLACFCGLVIFAYYAKDGCDPLAGGLLDNAGKIMMLFVVRVLSVPSIPGLFMAAVWAGALSTASSNFNSAATVIWLNLVKPYVQVRESRVLLVVKGITISLGVVIIALSLIMQKVGGSIVQIVFTFASSMSGPLSALFLVGGFFPWVNWQGACAGIVVGLIYGNWLAFGSFLYNAAHPFPPLTAPVYNCTMPQLIQNVSSTRDPTGVDKMYAISFLWYKGIIMGISIIVMLLVTVMTGYRDPKSVSPELMHPWIRYLMGYKDDDDDAISEDKKSLEKQNQGFENAAYANTTLDDAAAIDTRKPSTSTRL